VLIRGAARLEEGGAEEHIDRMAKKYMGVDEYPWRSPAEQRIQDLRRADGDLRARQLTSGPAQA
jgi:hypothetical protein